MFPVSMEKCWKQWISKSGLLHVFGRSWGPGARRWTTRISEAAGDQVGCSLDYLPTLGEKLATLEGEM